MAVVLEALLNLEVTPFTVRLFISNQRLCADVSATPEFWLVNPKVTVLLATEPGTCATASKTWFAPIKYPPKAVCHRPPLNAPAAERVKTPERCLVVSTELLATVFVVPETKAAPVNGS